MKMREEHVGLSVVIPAFNAEAYIGDLLACFEEQSNSNWEVIIVDDGSTDKTQDVVRQYSQIDDRISLYLRDRGPKGAQTCRNIGIDKATGTYISIIDADDLIKPYFVEQRLVFMDSHPEIDYATFRGKSVYESATGELIEGKSWGERTTDDLLKRFLKADYPFGVWNNIYKADLPKKIKFDEKVKVYQDFDFIVRMLLLNYKHAFDNNSSPDYFYRQGHTGTITASFISNQKYESTKYLFDKISDLLRKSGKDDCLEDFYRFYILQYKRVCLNGTRIQITDFCDYIKKTYNNSIKIDLVRFLLHKNKPENHFYRKCVHLIFGMLFEPQELNKIIAHKFGRKQ